MRVRAVTKQKNISYECCKINFTNRKRILSYVAVIVYIYLITICNMETSPIEHGQQPHVNSDGIRVLSSYYPDKQPDYNAWMRHVYKSIYDIAYGSKRTPEKKLLTNKLNFIR